MKNLFFIIIFLLAGTLSSEAVIKETEAVLVSDSILAKKQSYARVKLSNAEMKQILAEKRKERNRKVKAVMEVAKSSVVPAKLVLDSIQGGVVNMEILEEKSKAVDAWRTNGRAPSELDMPWNMLVGFLFSLVFCIILVVMYRRQKEKKRAAEQAAF